MAKEASVIGIAGGSGSGKSTFAGRLKEQFPDEIALVSCDNYYLSRHHMSFEERKLQNYDSPEAFEFDLMVRQIRELMDMRIYVETDADERILRRARRDMRQRGRDLDGIIAQYLATVKPIHNTYVEPTKVYADIIINGGMNDTAFDLVKNKIQSALEESK